MQMKRWTKWVLCMYHTFRLLLPRVQQFLCVQQGHTRAIALKHLAGERACHW